MPVTKIPLILLKHLNILRLLQILLQILGHFANHPGNPLQRLHMLICHIGRLALRHLSSNIDAVQRGEESLDARIILLVCFQSALGTPGEDQNQKNRTVDENADFSASSSFSLRLPPSSALIFTSSASFLAISTR